MTKAERRERVLRQLRDNIERSRQSSEEWFEVLTAYNRWLELDQMATQPSKSYKQPRENDCLGPWPPHDKEKDGPDD